MISASVNELINTVLALIFSGLIISGVAYGPKEIKKWIRKETVTRVSKGTISLESYTQKLTGKKLDI